MDPKLLANAFNKWIHLSSAGVIVGGLLYLRFILIPTLDGLPEAQRTPLWQVAYKKTLRWQLYAMALLILTGIHNIMTARKTFGNFTPDQVSMYWMIFWMKIILFLTAFILVHLLMIPTPSFRRIQEAYRWWVSVLTVTGLLILFLSGYLTLMRLSLINVQGGNTNAGKVEIRSPSHPRSSLS